MKAQIVFMKVSSDNFIESTILGTFMSGGHSRAGDVHIRGSPPWDLHNKTCVV